MSHARSVTFAVLALGLVCATQGGAQQDGGQGQPKEERAATADAPSSQTMRPVVRGRTWAVSTMKMEATRAAEKILLAGGHAFGAAVAAQAVLGQVDPAMNGVGSDAELLLYDAKTKQVVSINAEGPAPKLATIDWYKQNNGGKLPTRDGVLSAIVPGTADAWDILLDRWGTTEWVPELEQTI